MIDIEALRDDSNSKFKTVQFMTAEEKEKVFKNWKRFLASLKENNPEKSWGLFPMRLYEHLHMHCGYIAHYNHKQFFSTYFEDPADTREFIKEFEGYGWGCGDYEDIHNAMLNELNSVKASIIAVTNTQELKDDLGRIKRLMMKHSLSTEDLNDN